MSFILHCSGEWRHWNGRSLIYWLFSVKILDKLVFCLFPGYKEMDKISWAVVIQCPLSSQNKGLAWFVFVRGDVRVNKYWGEQAWQAFRFITWAVWSDSPTPENMSLYFLLNVYPTAVPVKNVIYGITDHWNPFPVVSIVTYKGRCFVEKHPFLYLTQNDFELNSLLLSLDGICTREGMLGFDVASSSFCSCKFYVYFFKKNDDYFLILTN